MLVPGYSQHFSSFSVLGSSAFVVQFLSLPLEPLAAIYTFKRSITTNSCWQQLSLSRMRQGAQSDLLTANKRSFPVIPPNSAGVQSQTCWTHLLCLETPERQEVWEKCTVPYNPLCPQPRGTVALRQLKATTYFLAAVSSPTVPVATAHRLGHAPLTVLFIEGPQ